MCQQNSKKINQQSIHRVSYSSKRLRAVKLTKPPHKTGQWLEIIWRSTSKIAASQCSFFLRNDSMYFFGLLPVGNVPLRLADFWGPTKGRPPGVASVHLLVCLKGNLVPTFTTTLGMLAPLAAVPDQKKSKHYRPWVLTIITSSTPGSLRGRACHADEEQLW